MKYFAVNEELEKTISQIKKDILLSMNGICADNINDSGLKYNQNFGVTFTRLREIALKYTSNYDLSYRLWQLSIRETKILATLLCPPESINGNNFDEWINEINTSELSEIISFSLLSKVQNISNMLINLLSKDNYYHRLTAYHTLSRIAQHLTESEICHTIEGFNLNDLDFISAYRAIESFICYVQTNKTIQVNEYLNALRTRIEEEVPRLYSNLIIDLIR